MIDLSIDVSYIDQVVKNGGFDNWSNDIPEVWEVVPGDGIIAKYGVASGNVLGITDVDDDSPPYIEQQIPTEYGGQYDLEFVYRGSIKVEIGYYVIPGVFIPSSFNEDYDSAEYDKISTQFQGGYGEQFVRITPTAEFYDYMYMDYITITEQNWWESKLPLDVTEIPSGEIENIALTIERELFSFRANTVNLKIYDYGEKEGYFNTNTFIDNIDRIFRFDINITYKSRSGDKPKTFILFSNRDAIKRKRGSSGLKRYIELELAEISTLVKENGWYLGDLIQEVDDDGDNVGSAYYKYDSYRNGVVAGNLSIQEVFDNLKNDFVDICSQNSIPVLPSGIEVINEVDGESDIITTTYEETIGTGSGEMVVVDAVLSPTGRIFMLLLDEDQIGESINKIRVYEIINGTTIRPTDNYIRPPGSESASFGDVWSAGFIHDYNGHTTTAGGYTVAFAAISIYNAGSAYWAREFFYRENSSSDDSGDNLVYTGGNTHKNFGAGDAKRWKCRYYDNEEEDYVSPLYYDSNLDNMLWIRPQNDLRVIESGRNKHIFSDMSTRYSNDPSTISIAKNMVSKVPRFPTGYTFSFENITPSAVMREIALTQDAVWYFSYSGDKIKMVIKRRALFDDPEIIPDNDILDEITQVEYIKFSDLSSQLFDSDPNRLQEFIYYYTNRYARGILEKDIMLDGYFDLNLGDIVSFNSDTKRYMVKEVELDNVMQKTNIIASQVVL